MEGDVKEKREGDRVSWCEFLVEEETVRKGRCRRKEKKGKERDGEEWRERTRKKEDSWSRRF